VGPKALAVGAFGARGVGKTQWAKRWLKARAAPRLAAWDYKHDPALSDLGQAFTSLPDMCRAMAAKRFSVRYLVDHDGDVAAQFDLFCRACWLAGDLDMYVSELPEVSKPGRAPAAWKKCVNVGREYKRHDGQIVGITILADAQRAAECDKSFISNLDLIHCGRMGHDDDAMAVAKKLHCPWQELMTLPDLHYFERAPGALTFTRGVLTFGNSRKNKSEPKKAP
jgi:hypothetical protein